MDPEETLSKFVRMHLKELTGPTTTKQLVKELRQSFFERHKLSPVCRFSNGDVARKVIETILKAKTGVPEQQIVTTIKTIPFICDEIKENEVSTFVTKAKFNTNSYLTNEELRKIREDDYLASVEAQFKARAEAATEAAFETERLAILKMKIDLEAEKHSLDELKSKLDSLPPDVKLLDSDSVVSEKEPNENGLPTIWWKEIGLETDPFPRNQGLFGIPEAKYNELVVQTSFIKSYIKRIEQTPEELLGKTIIVLGEFGSGKTTLFQMMAHRAGRRDVLPILTFLDPSQTITKITNQLISQIMMKISEAFPHRTDSETTSSSFTYDDIGTCIQTMAAVAKSSSSKGFLLLIDGLHKPEIYQKQSLLFLRQLQSFQERMANTGIDCGIIIAGSPAWETELHENPSLSGSFFNFEKMLPLSEEHAVEAVIRRINSFVPAGVPRPSITKEPLREAFHILSKRLLRPPTFRDYLDHIRDRLIARQYNEIGISVALHIETIELVKKEARESSLGSAFNQLSDPNDFSPAFREVCGSILSEARSKFGIPESDILFDKNMGAFRILRNNGFITLHRSSTTEPVTWHLSSKMVTFLQSLYDKHKIRPEDAIDSFFANPVKVIPEETQTMYGPIKKEMGKMAASWRSGWPEVATLVEKSATIVSRIDKATEDSDGSSNFGLEDLKVSLKNIFHAIMFIVGDKDADSTFDLDHFANLWCAAKIENLDAQIAILNRSKPLPQAISERFGILHLHKQALTELCSLLTELVRGESIAKLNSKVLTFEDAIKLHEARMSFDSQQYAATVDKISELMDYKIKDTLFPILRCVYGHTVLKILPPDIKDGLKRPRGNAHTKRAPDQNFFYDVSRSEYAKIIFQRQYRQIIFGELISDQDMKRLNESMELLFSLSDREAHKDRVSYFREHAPDIAQVLQMVPHLCEIFNQIVERFVANPEFKFNINNLTNTIEFTFGVDEKIFLAHHLGEAETRKITFDLLTKIECGELTLPPMEIINISQYSALENIMGVLQILLKSDHINAKQCIKGFGFDIVLTQKGMEKLSHLRK